MLRSIIIASFALVAGAFANTPTWTTSWTGNVAIDMGGKEEGKLTKSPSSFTVAPVTDGKDGKYTATFWDGSKETWTFSGDTYTWNDGTVEVTAKKITTDKVAVEGFAKAKGVNKTTMVYGNPTCKPVSKTAAKDACEMPKNIVWAFSMEGTSNYFILASTNSANKPRVLVVEQTPMKK